MTRDNLTTGCPNGTLFAEDFTEKKVVEFFNSAMMAAGLCGENKKPVLNCFHNADKRFAFLEMSSMDEATKALENLDDMEIAGNSVKITRPQDYQPPGMMGPGGMIPPGMMGAGGVLGAGGMMPGMMPGMMNPLMPQQAAHQQLLALQMRQQQMQQLALMSPGGQPMGAGALARCELI